MNLPDGWDQFKTSDGANFYLNKKTGQTQWQSPGWTLEGDWCWMEDEHDGFVPGKIVSKNQGKIEYLIPGGQLRSRPEKGFVHIPLHPDSLTKNVDDLVFLDDMNIPLILHALRERCKRGHIYTNVGTILIAINPYKVLPLYTPEAMEIYSSREGKDLPPHPFIIADDCYRELLESRNNQSILVSGESGAGKTETTKVVLQYLAEIAGSRTGVEQKILNATPILEAFGNAKTIRNNNSSRFGKWVEIHFDKSGKICGARILNYLLEKSRVPFQAKDERNYHIFYQLLQGGDPEMLNEFGLLTVKDYHYTSQSGCISVEGVEDASEFNQVCESMRELGFSQQEMKTIFRIVAAVLVLGNIKFCTNTNDDSKTKIARDSIDTMKRAALLLSVDPLALEKSLVSREIKIKKETTVIPLDLAAAEECRDTLSKHLYGSLFEWLVKRINKILSENLNPSETRVVGVLDIFGFEIFDHNSFEQLCINFANEKLQQKFNQTTFKEEEVVYQKENICYHHIEFIDNQSVLDLIEKKPDGILCILDDELKMPHKTRSDQNFLTRSVQKHNTNERFKKPIKTPEAFSLWHYAGEVTYQVTGFLDKNKDQMYDDLIHVMMASRDPFVVSFMGDALGQKKTSLSAQFRLELSSLMSMINTTNPHYIRCIKPNTKRQPAASLFDTPMCLRQLTYAGVFEAVSIRRQGYPFRYTHRQFYERYKCLAPRVKGNDYLELCKELLKQIPGNLDKVQIGTTMVLYKSEEQRSLDMQRNLAMGELIVCAQALFRRYRARQKYMEMAAIREEFRQALQCDDMKKLQKLVDEAETAGGLFFDFREFREANTLIRRWREVKRLNKLVEECLEAIQGNPDPPPQQLSRLSYLLLEAETLYISNPLTDQARMVIDEIEKTKKSTTNILQALERVNHEDIQRALKEARAMNVKLPPEIVHRAEREVLAIKEELMRVESLLKVLSIVPHGLYPGVVISQQGDVEVDAEAHCALLNAMELAKDGFRTPEGIKTLKTAELVHKIREATRTGDWKLVEQLLMDAQNRLHELLDAPEITSAHDQLWLRKGIAGTIENLQKAAQSLDVNLLHISIRAALHYDLQGIEPYRELELRIRRISAALENAIATKNLEKLIAATSMADVIGYSKEDYMAATKARDIVIGLLNELSEHIMVVPEKEQTEELLERCKRAQLVNEQTRILEKRLTLQNEDLIKLQMKGALVVNDHERVRKKTFQLKELFFNQFGSNIEIRQCPLIRSPSDFAKGRVFGKDKLKTTMLQWTKEVIPNSLTIINDKALVKEATRIFKNILGWTGDKQLSYPAILAKEILQKGISSEFLRNEIYAQIVKQITYNPNEESKKKLWQLLLLCVRTFAPTAEFENYFEAWLRLKGESRSIIRLLYDTQFRGCAKSAPTPEEITTEANKQSTQYRESMIAARLASQRTSVGPLEEIMRQSALRVAEIPSVENASSPNDPSPPTTALSGSSPPTQHKQPDG